MVTGAGGQLGSVLVPALRKIYGELNVISSDIYKLNDPNGPSFILDATSEVGLGALMEVCKVTQVYHLAAILSAKGETDPLRTWKINMDGLLNVLDVARDMEIDRVFYPSSIAVFGDNTPKVNTPQETILSPSTVYGISKAAGEDWCNYYYQQYGLDVRSVRYPGLIGYESLPGGGTTDYAVEIFHEAIKNKTYTCFLNSDTKLPMMYMPDAIRATIELMSAPKEQIKTRTSYNLVGMSFTPKEIFQSIQRHIPDMSIKYEPDFRETIARSWVESIDDSEARRDWNWKEEYGLDAMVEDMLKHLG